MNQYSVLLDVKVLAENEDQARMKAKNSIAAGFYEQAGLYCGDGQVYLEREIPDILEEVSPPE